MKVLTASLTLALSLSSFAAELFVVKKSYNTKNVLHYYADVSNCEIQRVYAQWTMGEQDGHVEGLAFFEKSFFNPKGITEPTNKSLVFTIGALEKMRAKLPDHTITIELENCKPKAYVEVEHRQVQLKEIFVDGQKSGLGFTTKSMTVKGAYTNGDGFSRKYLP